LNGVIKSGKNSKPSMDPALVKKAARAPGKENLPWIEDYQDFFTYRMQPISEGFLEKLGNELIVFAETEEKVLRLEWFFTKKRINPATGWRWAKKYEKFGEAYKLAKTILGMRREAGAMHFDYNHATISQAQRYYDETWISADEIKASLELKFELERKEIEHKHRKELMELAHKIEQGNVNSDGKAIFNITLMDYPSSGMVPTKKTKEKE
jgi:hypothetical protein